MIAHTYVDAEKWGHIPCWMGVQTGTVPVEVSIDVPQNSEHQLPQH